jgi:UDP-3-O-[3-hydroxymyristoyl] glucosamine N-acyltransferase
VGEGTIRLTAIGPLDQADDQTLSLLASPRYLAAFRASRAGAVLVAPAHAGEPRGPRTRIVVEDPHAALDRVLRAMYRPDPQRGAIHPTVRIGRGVRLGREVRLGPGVILGDGVQIGEGSELEAGVVCGPGTRIGARCRIHPGAVLGAAGFGFVSDRDGHTRIPHIGRCILEDDVEIGANSCVDRGSIGDTVIGAGTKLDNLVHVGHNARLGARCLVMGGSVIAGSADIGDDVIVAGHAAIGGHFRVGHRARIGAKAGVISDVPDDGAVSGFPARPHRQFLRAQAALYRLARISSRLEELAGTPPDA